MFSKGKQSKIPIAVLYSIIILWILGHVWNEQSIIWRGGSSPLYRNLMDNAAYVKNGFDLNEIQMLTEDFFHDPDTSSAWRLFQSSPLIIKSSPMRNLPKRTYLSPRGKDAEEFTIIIPVEINNKAFEYLNNDTSILPKGNLALQAQRVPGIYLAGIGENWEIFLNGQLLRSELAGARTWRDIHFPLDKSLIVQGINILAFRIRGDPAYSQTGFFHTVPYYLDDYETIQRQHQNLLLVILTGAFGFIGVYYLLLFFYVKNKQESFNLYFGIFSILLCIYSFTRHYTIYYMIQNSNIVIRLEHFSVILLLPALCMFLESLVMGKITKITRGYLVFCIYLAFTQIFFCLQYGQEIMEIWNISALLYYSYVFIHLTYYYFWDKKGPIKSGTAKTSQLPIGNIVFCMTVSYICGILDVLEAIFFHTSFDLFIYSTFVIQIGMAFSLARRFTGMYKGLERSNIILEEKVEERTKKLQYYNNHLRKAFSTYLSGDVVDEIIADPTRLQLGGINRQMTVMFTDIKNFSNISEKLHPKELVSLLNEYLSAMSDTILEQKGTIDKYVGDAIVAFFGAPLEQSDHAKRACASAISMKKLEKALNRKFLEQGLSHIPLSSRIGINTGDMVVGNMGTEKKMNYTVMGNSVNLASRLESANKNYKTWILVSEETVKNAGEDFLFRKLDRIRVVGINEPVRIYELLERKEEAPEALFEQIELFHKAHELFEARQWKEAEKLFDMLIKHNPEDAPLITYRNRCKKYRSLLPKANWDGVYNLGEK